MVFLVHGATSRDKHSLLTGTTSRLQVTHQAVHAVGGSNVSLAPKWCRATVLGPFPVHTQHVCPRPRVYVTLRRVFPTHLVNKDQRLADAWVIRKRIAHKKRASTSSVCKVLDGRSCLTGAYGLILITGRLSSQRMWTACLCLPEFCNDYAT